MGCGVARWVGALGVLAVVLPSLALAQISDFCPLLEGRIVAEDGQFLGRITDSEVANDSLVNRFGPYGSQLSSTSIFNQSTYGSTFSPVGPFNPNSTQPPRIIRNGQTVARLTVNAGFANRVDPNGLVAWLRSSGPGSCTEPTPPSTATPTQTPEDTATPTEPTETPTPEDTFTPTNTPTFTNTGTATDTPTITNTPTVTNTPTATFTSPSTPTPGPCYGDCNYDGAIRINELITGVSIALGDLELAVCPSFDITLDLRVNVGELVRAVGNALRGCIPLVPPTNTPTITPTMPFFTETPTRTPTEIDTPTATPTATIAGQCPAVTPLVLSFRSLGELSEEEVELTDLATTLRVEDTRQKHGVEVRLSSCADVAPGDVDVRIESPGLEPRSLSAPVESVCGDIEDAVVTTTYDLPVGDYPLSVFVSGSDRFTGGELRIGQAPLQPVSSSSIFSTISLVAGELEITDLRTTFEVSEPCGLVQATADFVVAGLAPNVEYEVRIVLDGAQEDVSPVFVAGTATNPATSRFTVTHQDLPVGEHTFAVFVNQLDQGPALYQRESTLEIRAR